jgi:glycyl-tRNA synthetase
MKIPFGIAQIGKAFRNEIIARQFIFRMREFEQMEMQFFVPPGEELKWYDYWKSQREKWHKNLNLGEDLHRFHDHIKLAHYANAACDIEFDFPMGFKELEGIHSRTDFDLKQHEQHSGKKLSYFDPELNKSYVPYVIETSIGLDRMFLAILSASFKKEVLDGGATRTVLKIPAALAPVKVANKLKFDYNFQIDQKDSIGKRYRRQDAIGTPICITIDHQTKEDQTVTIRFRDSMKQERVDLTAIEDILENELGWKKLLLNLA